ncbi:MAG: methyltransferase domain-containing protein [Deltaproteobacteria bacterium]|nr:methyltransferase domain-containing protein [Deltaproteobacteria bacterium]
MTWEDQYKESGKLWGEEPSMLAAAAVKYLQAKAGTSAVSILDIGCGYGRDALYLSGNLNCKILGIDVSEKAIEMALNTAAQLKKRNMKFQCR